MPISGEGYSPAGRLAIFDVPAYDDVADLNVLFKRFADTCVGIGGDELTGTFTLDGSPLVTEDAEQTLENKTLNNPTFTGIITGLPAPNVSILSKTATYTIALPDAHKLIVMDSVSDTQILIPTDASVAFPIGTTILGLRENTGAVSFAAVSPGTTSVQGTPGLKLRARYSIGSAIKIAANTWRLNGDLGA